MASIVDEAPNREPKLLTESSPEISWSKAQFMVDLMELNVNQRIVNIVNKASRAGLAQGPHSSTQGVISFHNSYGERIDVYYNSGTIATSIAHPRLGTTQLFKKNAIQARQLDQIFHDPHMEFLYGYRRIQHNERHMRSFAEDGGKILAEESALSDQLKLLDKELSAIQSERDQVAVALEVLETENSVKKEAASGDQNSTVYNE